MAIATSAFQAPRWLGIAALSVMGVALIWLALQLPRIAARIPWEIRRKDPERDTAASAAVRIVLLRYDLKIAFDTLQEMTAPSVADLRAFADNLAGRLRNDGYDMAAKKVEVHLPDDATAVAIKKRRDDLRDRLMAMLLSDRFV